MGEPSIGGKFADRIVDAPVGTPIGEALVEEFLNEEDHLGDVVGRGRIVLDGLNREGFQIFEKSDSERLDETLQRDIARDRPCEGLVVDVGQIHRLLDCNPEKLDGAPEEILEDVGPKIADMGEVVDGRSAGVHPEFAAVKRSDDLFFSRFGVEQFELHVSPKAFAVGGSWSFRFP